jgi:hypothetical protein
MTSLCMVAPGALSGAAVVRPGPPVIVSCSLVRRSKQEHDAVHAQPAAAKVLRPSQAKLLADKPHADDWTRCCGRCSALY